MNRFTGHAKAKFGNLASCISRSTLYCGLSRVSFRRICYLRCRNMGIETSFSLRTSRSVVRYAVAVAAVLTVLLFCRELNRFTADYVPYVILFPAIAFSAWYCGVGPSLPAIA